MLYVLTARRALQVVPVQYQIDARLRIDVGGIFRRDGVDW